MFDYSTSEGFKYARILLRDFLASDFFENPNNLEELVLTEDELRSLFNTRLFKQFLIQRESDYTTLASFLAEVSYNYEGGFGTLFDINAGKYEVVSAFDEYSSTEPIVVTEFTDPLFFKEDTSVVQARIGKITSICGKQKDMYPILMPKRVLYGDSDAIKGLTLDKADTIFYFNEVNLNTMLLLLRHSMEHGTRFVTGVVTNVFDSTCNEKFATLDETI